MIYGLTKQLSVCIERIRQMNNHKEEMHTSYTSNPFFFFLLSTLPSSLTVTEQDEIIFSFSQLHEGNV